MTYNFKIKHSSTFSSPLRWALNALNIVLLSLWVDLCARKPTKRKNLIFLHITRKMWWTIGTCYCIQNAAIKTRETVNMKVEDNSTYRLFLRSIRRVPSHNMIRVIFLHEIAESHIATGICSMCWLRSPGTGRRLQLFIVCLNVVPTLMMSIFPGSAWFFWYELYIAPEGWKKYWLTIDKV